MNKVKKFNKAQINRALKPYKEALVAERQEVWNSGYQAGFQAGKSAGEIEGRRQLGVYQGNQRAENRHAAITRVLEGYSKMMETVAQSLTTIAGEIGR